MVHLWHIYNIKFKQSLKFKINNLKINFVINVTFLMFYQKRLKKRLTSLMYIVQYTHKQKKGDSK
ncbi:hypothetical protein I926_04215 [Pasteurella multocida subsp. multocida OH4807]|nr:hypothetical protein I926_04215 [Pasteurella multocida subsp. multocida OH4807]